MARRAKRRGGDRIDRPARSIDYHNLQSPFAPARLFSEDRVAAIHEAALKINEDLGMRILLPEARELLCQAGGIVDEDTQMVRIGREIIASALETAPRSFVLKAGRPEKDIDVGLGRIIFQPGAGCPHATDRVRGRRPGTYSDFRELVRLTDHFDVLHMVPPLVEPQDVETHLRHYEMTKAWLTLSSKVGFVYSRGTPQTEDCFEMIATARGLSDADFRAQSHCYSIINTNSPRQIDIPMAQGLIDFARYGQMMIVTPFTLIGAMAPITVAGAITLSHAEALAAITLHQLAGPGSPVCYGTFTSNVDMKSGSPAFGTPEHFQANLLAGQMARHIGLPWRSATGSTANVNDAQAAGEMQMGLWGCLMAGATMTIHAAGWLEGGLTISYEKLVTDCEILNMVAELCAPVADDAAAIGMEAIGDVAPGGHFFSTGHTMERYATAFYEPFVHERTNFGTWEEAGSQSADARATKIWQEILRDHQAAGLDEDNTEALDAFVAKRVAEGGALPVS